MDKCTTVQPGLEYRMAVSEWLLHSSKDDYLFSPSDKDSHTPLLIHQNPRHFSSSDIRAQKRSETKMDSNARRNERQKINKAKGSGGATSGTRSYDKPCTTTYQEHYRVGCGTRHREDQVQRRLLLHRRPVERQHL